MKIACSVGSALYVLLVMRVSFYTGLVAKNKSLFDDKPQEFDSLAASVKRDLTATNRRIQELKGELSSQQTARSEQPPQRASKTTLEHQRTIVVILQGWNAQVLKSLEHILEVRAQVSADDMDTVMTVVITIDAQEQEGPSRPVWKRSDKRKYCWTGQCPSFANTVKLGQRTRPSAICNRRQFRLIVPEKGVK